MLQPFRPIFERQTDGRLYSAENIALVRIFLRLLAQAALPDWAARAAIAYRRDELLHSLRSGPDPDAVLVMHGVRGAVVAVSDAEKMRATYKLPLTSVTRGVEAALTQLRKDKPEIWTGRRREAGSTLVTEVLRV